ncbi:hypothetical protein V1293_005701 [Bradyrhizobium sp. AZCC 1693]
MLWRQTIYFLCKCRNLANFLHEFWSFGFLTGATTGAWLTGFLNRTEDMRGIHLESAALVLHMICVT